MSKPLSLLFLALLAFLTPSIARADVQGVEAAFQQVQQAIKAKDVATLRRIVHPSFEMLHGGGAVEDFESWLRVVQAGTLSRQRDDATEFDVQVRTVGPVAYRSSLVRFRNLNTKEDVWVRGSAISFRTGRPGGNSAIRARCFTTDRKSVTRALPAMQECTTCRMVAISGLSPPLNI